MPHSDFKKYVEKISGNLVELLDIYSMNTLELSQKSGISYSSLHNLINKKQNPTLETLVGICKVFNIGLAQLVGELSIFRGQYSSQIKEIPLINWKEVINYINANTIKEITKVVISCQETINNDCFALQAAPYKIFLDNSILVFEKIELPLANYNNCIVLVSSNDQMPSLKKLIVDGENLFLESIEKKLPIRLLNAKDIILARLIQSRTDFVDEF